MKRKSTGDVPPRRTTEETSGTITWSRGKAFYSAGEGTLRVPMTMHANNRVKLLSALRSRPEVPKGAVILLQGGSEISVYDTDTTWDFKQESNFQYLFGVKEPGCKALLNVDDGHAVLFIPKLPENYAAWNGPIKPPAWFHRAYEVDEVRYVDPEKENKDVAAVCAERQAKSMLVLRGVNRDSGSSPVPPCCDGLEHLPIVGDGCRALWEELAEARVIKSAEEVKILQFANDVSSEAHIELMRGPSSVGTRERLAAAAFKYAAALRGCERMGYHCICPAGPRNTYLHYGHSSEPNAEVVGAGTLTLRDMGAEYHCYSSDVTCTYPVGGTFTPEQRIVYEAVWEAVLAVEQTIRPGIVYKDMHRLAQRTMLTEMRNAGLFSGDVDEMMKAQLCNKFMFHGLGHSLGLDVHDVGGYEPGKSRGEDTELLENLRLGRELKEGMVLTVEPGFYFTDFLIAAAMADPTTACFINKERLEGLRGVGGVRIEDDVVITATGCRILTNVPRTCAEIEAVMAGQQWSVGAATCREYQNSSL